MAEDGKTLDRSLRKLRAMSSYKAWLAMLVILAAMATILQVSVGKPGGRKVITTQLGDVRIVSDREESVGEFFQRNRVIVGGVSTAVSADGQGLEGILTASALINRFDLHHPSPNDDPSMQMHYMTTISVLPPQPDVAKLLRSYKPKPGDNFALILHRDEGKADTYTPIGYTTLTPVGFFTERFAAKIDGVPASSLLFRKK